MWNASAQERSYLERQVRRHRVARSLSERCRVILRCADGLPSKDVAAELGLHEHTVGKWRRRFLKDRCDGLLDEARPGRPRTIDDDQVAAVIERTLRTTPVDATHWSIRSMAARSEEHTSELQSHVNLVCRLLLEKKKKIRYILLLQKKKTRTVNSTK